MKTKNKKRLLRLFGETALMVGVVEIIANADIYIEQVTLIVGTLLCIQGAWNENH